MKAQKIEGVIVRKPSEFVYQLRNAGVKNTFLIRPEINQMPSILFDNEVILKAVIGGHPSGFSVLLATDRRVLFIDKIFFGVIVEDTPYDKIEAAKFHCGLVFGEISLQLADKDLHLRRVTRGSIKPFVMFIQHRMQEMLRARRSAEAALARSQGQRPYHYEQPGLTTPQFPSPQLNSATQMDPQTPANGAF